MSNAARYRSALASIREDAREAHDALLGDDFERVGELLDKIENDAISGLCHISFGPELVIPVMDAEVRPPATAPATPGAQSQAGPGTDPDGARPGDLSREGGCPECGGAVERDHCIEPGKRPGKIGCGWWKLADEVLAHDSEPKSSLSEPKSSLFAFLRRGDENLPHLLDTAVQILRDEGLLDQYVDVLREDMEAASLVEAEYDPAERWEA